MSDNHTATRTRPKRRAPMPLAAAVAFSLVIATGTYLLVRDGGDSDAPKSPAATDAPQIRQATWKIKTFAAGTAGAPSKGDRRLVASERDGLVATVTAVADALVLDADALEGSLADLVTPSAAKALQRSGLVLAGELEKARSLARRASIGLDANGGARAAAQIRLVVEARTEQGPVTFAETANLFLRKQQGRWVLVAFDGQVAPRKGGKS